jgi:hypothetical protein
VQAKIYRCHNCRDNEEQHSVNGVISDLGDTSSLKLDLKDGTNLYEITIPTCSYRMGVPRMGFGAAVVGEHAQFYAEYLFFRHVRSLKQANTFLITRNRPC